MSLRILITNNTLVSRAGSELYVRDVALALLKRGHEPIAYSTNLGEVARELRAANVQVVDDLSVLSRAPDLIHGQHQMETMTALLRFPGVPAINYCHSSTNWHEAPISFPRVLRYVAVDQACRDRLLVSGIPDGRIRVLLNFVDLDRFKARSKPLPPRPQRALVFSNYASAQTHLPAVLKACRRAQVPLDVIGKEQNNVSSEPEKVIGNYDLVFAKARCALEAMAVGAAVILCDSGGVGPLVTQRQFAELRPLNFGIRTLREALHPDILLREIARYEATEAAAVSEQVRATAGHEAVIDELVDLYRQVIEEQQAATIDIESEGRAAAAYLRQLETEFPTRGAASLPTNERLLFPQLRHWRRKLARWSI